MTLHDFWGLSPLFASVIAIIALVIKGDYEVRKWEEANRISDEIARSSEARPGVGTAVKSDAADKSGVEMGKVNKVEDMSLEEIVSRWKAEEKLWKEREAELLAKFPACSSCGERVTTSWEAHEDDCTGSAETGGEKADHD